MIYNQISDRVTHQEKQFVIKCDAKKKQENCDPRIFDASKLLISLHKDRRDLTWQFLNVAFLRKTGRNDTLTRETQQWYRRNQSCQS